ADPQMLSRRFSVVMGRIVLELRGQSCLALETLAPPRKQIVASRSFGRPLLHLEDLQSALAGHMARVAVKLRRQGSEARGLTVFLHTNPHAPREPQYRNACTLPLPEASSDTRQLLAWAVRGLVRIYRPGYRYQKVGVMLLDLVPAGCSPGNLFAAEEREQSEKLMQVLDAVNRRFGRGTLRTAREGFDEPGRMQAAHRSPAYTTRWTELPIVKAGTMPTGGTRSKPGNRIKKPESLMLSG
ncbi:MAG: DUF4113 domain-containing protein, partial [Candidatus Competibacteraceae bacterium]|nr:DUF4113 domain-containing protein [Candidatus Competibacteraceae bacterium]